MKKTLLIALLSVVAAGSAFAEEATTTIASTAVVAAAAPASTIAVEVGQVVVSTDGGRLGRVQRVAADGSPRVILRGLSELYAVPLSTVTVVDGRVVTTLTRAEIIAAN
jgi:hypothetical protein